MIKRPTRLIAGLLVTEIWVYLLSFVMAVSFWPKAIVCWTIMFPLTRWGTFD